MKRLALALLAAVAVLVAAGAASAHGTAAAGYAYTISNAAAGNELVIYARAADGSLSPAGSVSAGGLGTGAGLASQGAVTVTDNGRVVLAVNPGSDSLAAFRVDHDGAVLLDTAPSGGTRPVSVAVDRKLVYVLNKDNAALATVSGFRLGKDGLTPIPGSTRFLNAGATDAAQLQFTPDGDTLVVAGRSTNKIDTFAVGRGGLLGALKTFDVAPGGTPFGFDFDKKGHLLVSLAGVAGSSGAASYAVAKDGTVSTITAPVATGENAACWLVASKDGRFAYVANAASGSVSTFSVGHDGSITFLGAVSVQGMTPLDEALSEDGRTLYVLAAGSHGIVQLSVGKDGVLTYVGSQLNIPATAAGLAVS